MKVNHLVSVQPVKYRYHNGTAQARYDNVLAQQVEADKPNHAWTGDAT